MNVNSSASLFKISHAIFSLCVTPPISKHCLTLNREKKTATPIIINYENLRNCVSGLYSLCQLTYFCVCHLEIASKLFFQQSIQFPSISGSHVFSHHASGHDIIKSHDVIFFNEILMGFQ